MVEFAALEHEGLRTPEGRLRMRVAQTFLFSPRLYLQDSVMPYSNPSHATHTYSIISVQVT